MFGESGLFLSSPSPFAVVAAEDVEVLVLEFDLINMILVRQPAFAGRLFLFLAASLHRRLINVLQETSDLPNAVHDDSAQK